MLGASLRPRSRATTLERTSMPATQARLYTKDEELGKRDDDFRPKRAQAGGPPAWVFQPWKWRRRRQLVGLAVLALVYVFVHNIPTDLGPWNQRGMKEYVPQPQVGWKPPAYSGGSRPGQVSGQEPVGAPPRPPMDEDEETRSMWYYDGPIKFYRLKSSLMDAARMGGMNAENRNVLFAASSMKSVGNLLPMACAMAKRDRNLVHLVLSGRDTLSLEEVLEVNGVDTKSCQVYFHDARPDYGEYSSDVRAEISVAGAMQHIHSYMHPQAIIMDDSAVEDQFFTRAIRTKGRELNRVVIEIPAGRYEDFLWMTMLDSESLSNWFKPSIDILVHAPQESAGSLIRLIKSLEEADYAGLKVPRLTVEMPSKIEPFAKRYLEELQWPPIGDLSPIQQGTLTLRHRIPASRMSAEQASLRFVESFYPTNTDNNHVLILSPQVELSPLYFQYLTYLILQHKYATFQSGDTEILLGIALDVPTSFLNGTTPFVQPTMSDSQNLDYSNADSTKNSSPVPFLHQAPSATASLVFADKWATFHDFLTKRLITSHSFQEVKTPKLVPETEPGWLEYLLELMRARGWSMLHPASSFVTVHNELAQLPEEFAKGGETAKDVDKTKEEHAAEEDGAGPFLTADVQPTLIKHVEHEPVSDGLALHNSLPFGGDLPELANLPYMLYNGSIVDITVAEEIRDSFVPLFRRRSGGCDENNALPRREPMPLQADDLFCLPGMDLELEPIDEAHNEADEAEELARVIAQASALPMDAAASIASVMLASASATETATSASASASAEAQLEQSSG